MDCVHIDVKKFQQVIHVRVDGEVHVYAEV